MPGPGSAGYVMDETASPSRTVRLSASAISWESRQGIGTTMVRQLMSRVPGQHIGLQTEDAETFYASLGYRHQPVFMSAVVGEWLANDANARLRVS